MRSLQAAVLCEALQGERPRVQARARSVDSKCGAAVSGVRKVCESAGCKSTMTMAPFGSCYPSHSVLNQASISISSTMQLSQLCLLALMLLS